MSHISLPTLFAYDTSLVNINNNSQCKEANKKKFKMLTPISLRSYRFFVSRRSYNLSINYPIPVRNWRTFAYFYEYGFQRRKNLIIFVAGGGDSTSCMLALSDIPSHIAPTM